MHNIKAFEYQGQQHYISTTFLSNLQSFDERQQTDRKKVELCKEAGITLIQVPFWWNKKSESLASTVYDVRPDLFSETPIANPIPSSPTTLVSNNKISSFFCVVFFVYM